MPLFVETKGGFYMKKVLINIPHSSTKLTNEFFDRLLISHEELQEQLNILTDYYTDEIFENKNCINLKCEYSRLICDVERFKNDEDEVMSKIGMGAVYTKTTDGKDLIKLDDAYKNKIIEAVYDLHHALLDSFAERIIEERGECIVIDGHSFSEKWADMIGNKGPYPDICIGYEEDFCDKAYIERFKELAKEYGLTCKENYPFAGAIIPNKYYKTKDKRVKSIMIEINKKVYMNEETGEKTEGFEKVKELMGMLVGRCVNKRIRK